MTTAEPSQSDTSPPEPPPEEQHDRSPWLWVSVALGVLVVALGTWGLSKNADLSDANQKLDQQAENGSAAITTAKSTIDDVSKDLDATDQELASTKQDVADANAEANQAQKEADAAQQDAAKADNANAKLQDQLDGAQATAKAAQSKATVAADCAKAYVSAIGSLLDGGDIQAQAATVRDELAAITAGCKASFES